MGGVGALQEVPGRWHCPCGTPAGSPLGPSLGKRLPREEAGSEASDSCPGPARSFPVGRGPEERGAELCSSFRASTASWGGGMGGAPPASVAFPTVADACRCPRMACGSGRFAAAWRRAGADGALPSAFIHSLQRHPDPWALD